ncbi:MAG: O-antigen ligase family protein [Candidatus Pacebacteria bacterium]|nr:O-antigen ligase family protein [Candidatus Paceibacterota bacterium]
MPVKNNLEKIYFRIIEWGTYLVLLTPFIFIKDYFFPFVVPKTIFFRVIVCIIFIAYILLATANAKYRPRITPLTVVIFIFLGVLVLASITGVNFTRSFWSVFERMEGLLTFFHLFVFYIVLTSVFKERKYWERILSVSILIGIFIAFNALTSDNPATRGGGMLGNSAFFSAYILFNLFFAIIFLVTKTGVWRLFYGTAFVVFVCSLFFNPGDFIKGAVAAFIIGMIILLFGFLLTVLFLSDQKKLKIIVLSLIILFILGAFGFSQFDFVKERMDKLWQSNSVQARLVVWDMGWQGWQERFWLGWGLENFNVPFTKHYNPELPLSGDIWYDRVHNIVLDTGINSGIVGLLSYLSVFGVAIFGLLRLLSRVSEKKNIIVPLAMIALFFAYFSQNLFVFDMVSTYMMFFLSLAFAGFLISSGKEEAKEKIIPLPSFVGGFLIILTVFTLFVGNIQVARASKYVLKGIISPLEQSISYFQKAFKASPMVQFEGPEQFGSRINALSLQSNQNKELLSQGFGLAEEEFKKSITQNPLDFRLQLFLGRHYTNFYQFSGDKEKLALAEKALNKAVELSPGNQQAYFILAQNFLLQGDYEKAIEIFQKAVAMEPRLAQSHWYLFKAYRIAGKYDLALSELKEVEDLGFSWQGDASTLKEGIEVLKAISVNQDVLIALYEKGAELDPKDYSFWMNLAESYAATGQKEKAKNAAENLLQLKPELSSQVEQFLEELGY